MILGVTGPNEYENNVNNNWYTNTLARWTLRYTCEMLDWLKDTSLVKYNSVISRTQLDTQCELSLWKEIIDNIYLPVTMIWASSCSRTVSWTRFSRR